MEGRLASYLSVTCNGQDSRLSELRGRARATCKLPCQTRPPLNIPSPKELTESDDERPQSAQKPDTSNALNADSDIPVVSAILVSEAMETADSGQRNVDEEEAMADSDSSLESRNTRRQRNCRSGVRKPRISWHTIQVMDRDAMNNHEIQERLTDVARQEYEKGGSTLVQHFVQANLSIFMYFLSREFILII